MRNQKGFSAVEGLLVLVIIGVIGGVGYYVYNSRKETTKYQDNANKSSLEVATGKKQIEKDEVADWLLYEPTEKQYSIRIPDGWNLENLQSSNLYGRLPANITYKSGTKATVTSTEGGWDGASSFSLYYPKQNADQIVREGKEQGTITTNAGPKAHKYYLLQETDPVGIGYAKGSKVYSYYFDADGKYIQVQQYVLPGQTEQTELIEKSIKTLQIK